MKLNLQCGPGGLDPGSKLTNTESLSKGILWGTAWNVHEVQFVRYVSAECAELHLPCCSSDSRPDASCTRMLCASISFVILLALEGGGNGSVSQNDPARTLQPTVRMNQPSCSPPKKTHTGSTRANKPWMRYFGV